MIETLLLNFLYLLIPVIAFLIHEDLLRSTNKYIMIILISISMILCMTFPIYLNSGFIFDLRYIPFILTILFGGYRYAFPLYIVLNLHRSFLVGGEGMIQSLLFSTCIFLLVSLGSKKFNQASPKNRIVFSVVTSFMTMVLYLSTLSLQVPISHEFWILAFDALMTHVFMTMIIMLLIEKIISNMKTREGMIQSERLHTVSELAASVAHEIRNPLTATNGFLQLLQQSENLSEKDKSYVDFSLQELNRAEKIVSDFLAFSKPLSQNMIVSDLKEETEYVKNILEPYAHMHKVDIVLTFQNALKFSFDKNHIQQCLVNLYKNGIEAMKDHGGGILSVHVSQQKNNIILTIQDTGIGMTAEEVANLGKPYYSTKKYGTGLGMLMVYSTIQNINGTITVKSEKDKGTTFTISIPASQPVR